VSEWVGKVSVEEIEAYVEATLELEARCTSRGVALISISESSRQVGGVDAAGRRVLADAMRTRGLGRRSAASYAHVPHAVLRGVITALRWLGFKPVANVFTCESLDDAFARAEDKATELGQPLPPTWTEFRRGVLDRLAT
jgi:hypothetical protein